MEAHLSQPAHHKQLQMAPVRVWVLVGTCNSFCLSIKLRNCLVDICCCGRFLCHQLLFQTKRISAILCKRRTSLGSYISCGDSQFEPGYRISPFFHNQEGVVFLLPDFGACLAGEIYICSAMKIPHHPAVLNSDYPSSDTVHR